MEVNCLPDWHFCQVNLFLASKVNKTLSSKCIFLLIWASIVYLCLLQWGTLIFLQRAYLCALPFSISTTVWLVLQFCSIFLNWGFFIMREAQLGSKVHYFCSDYPRLKKKKRWCVIASGPWPTNGIEHEQRVVRKLDYPCSCWYFYIYEFTWWHDDYLPLENVVYLKNILVVIFWSVLNGYLSLKLDFP